jgi:hypothetical protein
MRDLPHVPPRQGICSHSVLKESITRKPSAVPTSAKAAFEIEKMRFTKASLVMAKVDIVIQLCNQHSRQKNMQWEGAAKSSFANVAQQCNVVIELKKIIHSKASGNEGNTALGDRKSDPLIKFPTPPDWEQSVQLVYYFKQIISSDDLLPNQRRELFSLSKYVVVTFSIILGIAMGFRNLARSAIDGQQLSAARAQNFLKALST